jgi:O-antigen ligase
LITARDMMIGNMAIAAAPAASAPATAFSERILLMVLFVTVLASSVAFIEPSPHDALMGVLVVACFVAGVRFERLLAVPFLLLLVWNVAGMMSLLNVPAEEKAIQYIGTSVYLAIAALLFACLFARNTMPRLATMRVAYVLTATLISLAGIAGYFSLFPHAHDLFATFDRALGAFKDPNVFGPFLIWPVLIVIERMLSRHIGIMDIVIVAILLVGLLLSFSRGAWFHFAVSCAVTLALNFLTAPTQAQRTRIFGLSAVGVVAVAAFIVILLSFDSIRSMFDQRAQLIQSYDVGDRGRFELQQLALSALLNLPNGMGPFEFARVYGLQQHNVYLQAFIVYGWIGGMAYIMLLLSTFWIAFRTVLVRTPWQPYLITALAAFVGEMLEGFVIDTDHWRHFYLLLGMIWGLAAATLNQTRQNQAFTPNSRMSYVGAA